MAESRPRPFDFHALPEPRLTTWVCGCIARCAWERLPDARDGSPMARFTSPVVTPCAEHGPPPPAAPQLSLLEVPHG